MYIISEVGVWFGRISRIYFFFNVYLFSSVGKSYSKGWNKYYIFFCGVGWFLNLNKL